MRDADVAVRIARNRSGRVKKRKEVWFVYFVRCADRSLYCGITTDVPRRVDEHNSSGKAAKYTRARRPVMLAWSEKQASRSAALKREWRLKRTQRKSKERLVREAGLHVQDALAT